MIKNVDALVVILEDCGVSERVSLLQVFGMIAKIKPVVSITKDFLICDLYYNYKLFEQKAYNVRTMSNKKELELRNSVSL